jgi:hypothetical protein
VHSNILGFYNIHLANTNSASVAKIKERVRTADVCVLMKMARRMQTAPATGCGEHGEGKGHPITGHEGPRGEAEVRLYSFSTSALGGGGWSAPRPGRFTPGKDPVPIIQEAGWAPGPVWTCAKNLPPHWDLIPGPSNP